MKKNYLVISLVAFSLIISCNKLINATPETIYENLYPPNNANDDAIEGLKKILQKREQRIEYIKIVEQKLNSPFLDHYDQIRQGIIVQCLAEYSENDSENQLIFNLIDKGKKHLDFYGIALSIKPYFFNQTIEVFKQPNLIAHFKDPNGGKIREYIIQDIISEKLTDATGLYFGKSYFKWKAWWDQSGRNLIYNNNESIYILQ